MAKRMNYDEFMEYAKAHYEKGGDTFFECWGEKEYGMFYPDGITKSEALKLFRRELSHQKDIAGYWY